VVLVHCKKMNRPIVHWPSSCTKCGFDKGPGKPCQVCGYSPSGSQPSGGAPVPDKAKSKGRRKGILLVVLLSAGGLLGVLFAFLLATEPHWPSGNAAAQASAVSAFPSSPAASAPLKAAALSSQEPAFPEVSPILLAGYEPPFDITKRTANPPFNRKEAFVDWMVKHTDQNARFLRERWDLATLLGGRGDFTHKRVREAFLLTPREYFSRNPRRAYDNAALPIGYGQTISGPDLVAHMTDYLDPLPGQKVLEIGTGSGYQSALLSELCNYVYTIEIIDALARETDAIFKRLEPRYPEYRNIMRKVDDGYYGWEEYAPFDKIIVTCGIDHVPPPLMQQLAPNGTMVIPIGPPSGQTVLRIVKKVTPDGTVSLTREDIYHGMVKVGFVPLTTWGGGVHRAQ